MEFVRFIIFKTNLKLNYGENSFSCLISFHVFFPDKLILSVRKVFSQSRNFFGKMEATFQNISEYVKPMVDRAISNARFHGINLHHGVPNLANGDCAIEAIADNISTRPCFGEVFNGGSEYNRKNWMEEAEDLVFKFSGGAGMSPTAFHEQWNILKQSGNYEYELGDYVLAAIAHCTKKDILIFNTKA